MAKDIKIKNFEATSENIKREQYHTEGKNLLDNQTNNAHNLLKKVWIDIYQTGKNMYQITDSNELFILEDVAHLIEGKLNYDVKNDLTRNHIIEKSDLDLTTYSDAKAVGYYRAVLAMLYQYNIQLPEYDLPKIMDKISLDEYKRIFSEIYFGARKIAGDMK
ncbi:hypothetical protein [Treponema sp.]|uniref:hypothetical protein n=1 Tax=Treponema sp. TaxID=166 RepID=UPI00298E2E27|nr:hypothetical protein [Treponema sp.]